MPTGILLKLFCHIISSTILHQGVQEEVFATRVGLATDEWL